MFKYLQLDPFGLIVGYFDSAGPIQSDDVIAIDPSFDAISVLGSVFLNGKIIPKPSGNFSWENGQWVNQDTPENEWLKVRELRAGYLAKSDWTQLPDVPLATKEAWAVYRQALRDVTLQQDPFNIVWPTHPT